MDVFPEQASLRVLMTTDTVGGVWSYSMELCRALQPAGVFVYLVTMGAPLQASQKKEVEALRNVTVYETDILLEWMENPWENIDASAAWLLQLEREVQPHLIHLNGFVHGSLPWQVPVLMVAHSDVYSWWHSVKGGEPPAAWHAYFKRVQAGLQEADFLVAPSRTMLQWVREIYKIDTPGCAIYNGRSAAAFYSVQKEPFVFSMGRIWDEAKNMQLLVQAAPLIHHPIEIAGDNQFAANRYATEGTTINYLGKLTTEAVQQKLAAAPVYALPAMYEPFGLSVLEAALSGCALVLGNIETLKEIWGNSAVYVDKNDATALAAAVNELMRNGAKRRHYAQRAIAQAAKYTTEAMVQHYLQVYQHLLQSARQKKATVP